MNSEYVLIIKQSIKRIDELNGSVKNLKFSDEHLVVRNTAIQLFIKQVMREIDKILTGLSKAEQIAWGTRGLFEIELLLKFILKSEIHFDEWFSYRIMDEREIINNIHRFVRNSNQNAHLEEFQKRLQKLDKQQKMVLEEWKKRKVDIPKPFTRQKNMAEIADLVGEKDRYDAPYKFSSKFIHPSAYIVFNNAANTNSMDYRNSFLIFAIDTLKETVLKLDSYILYRTDDPTAPPRPQHPR